MFHCQRHLTPNSRVLWTHCLCKRPQLLSFLDGELQFLLDSDIRAHYKNSPLPCRLFCHWDHSPGFQWEGFLPQGQGKEAMLIFCLHAYLSRSCLTSGQRAYELCVCIYVCLSCAHLPENNSVPVQWIKIINPENGHCTAKLVREAEQLQRFTNSCPTGNIQTSNISPG